MKKVIEIFLNDLKNITKSKMAVVILIGIIFIPGIYAWLNIDSNWNPYGNTGNLPIAVVNEDKGIKVFGENINIGQEIENSLKKNDGMKWTFTTKKDAKQKVEQGKYYGSIIIPKNFSSELTTIVKDEKTVKPTFDFYINDKKNPVAPIIVNKAITTVQTSVNQAFVNKIIYKFVDKAEDIDIITKGSEKSDEVIEKLRTAKTTVQELRTLISTTGLAADTTGKSLSAVRDLLPKMTDISKSTVQDIMEMRNAAKTFASTSENIEKDVSTVIEESDNVIKDLMDTMNQTNSGNIKANLNTIVNKIDKVLTVLKKLDSTLTTINNIVPLTGITNIDNRVVEKINKLNSIKDTINNTSNTLTNIDNIKAEINEVYNDITSIKQQYYDTVKSDLNNLYSSATNTINNATDIILNLNVSLDNVDSGLAHMISALQSGERLSGSVDTMLENFQADIDKMIELIEETKRSEIFNDVVKLLKNKPEEIADFITNPVATNQINLYEIKDYGSKMSPFYSILACWVGCTILTAILKIDVKKDKVTRKATNQEKFLGRFILFGILAMLQGLIIGLGDIFLGVQTINVFAFLLTLMLSSLVFVLIIYSLTSTFGKVGQALSIVIMVCQVAGSGGTFPIELLPRAFQLIQPFMPFYPALNAVRETIGGFYQLDYGMYLLILLCHTIIPLLLGLVVSNYTADIKEKVEEDLEKTGVIG